MSTKDKPIIIKQSFNKPRHIVWAAITEPEQMRKWFFGQIENFIPEVGFTTQFNVNTGERDFMHLWKLTEVVPGKKIVYNWRYEGYTGDSLVTFELIDKAGATLLKLIHSGNESFDKSIPEFKWECGYEGWKYFINSSLKNYLDKEDLVPDYTVR